MAASDLKGLLNNLVLETSSSNEHNLLSEVEKEVIISFSLNFIYKDIIYNIYNFS